MHDAFDEALNADLAKHEEALMTVLRSVVSECRGRGADIHKGMLLVDIKVESAKLATDFPVWLTLCDAEMTPLDDPRPLLANAGPIFPAARIESAEQRLRAAERLRDLVVAAMGRGRRPRCRRPGLDRGRTRNLEPGGRLLVFPDLGRDPLRSMLRNFTSAKSPPRARGLGIRV
jgi:hypothetical protein